MHNASYRAALAATAGLAWLLGAAPVAAQAEVPVDELVVTARKREEVLRDVPLTINAYSEEFIARSGMNSIVDVAAFTPNFSFAQAFGRTFERPVIRGQSNILGTANAGVFIDGVFVSGSIATTDLQNLERVEVVKGPQAALFGRATFAGAINYVTRKPSFTPKGRISATLAEHGETHFSAYHTGPLIADKLAYYVGARDYDYDGEYRNLGPGGGTVGQEHSRSYNVRLRATPTEALSADLRVDYLEDDDGHTAYYLQRSARNNCFPVGVNLTFYCGEVIVPKTVLFNLDQLPDPGLRRETWRYALTLNWDVAEWALTSVTALSDSHEETQRDADGTELNIAGFLQNNEVDVHDRAQEVRLTSPEDRRLRGLVGTYYYHRKTQAVAGTLGPVTRTTTPPDEVTNTAIFGFLEFDLNDQLTATLEGRAARDELDNTGTSRSGVLSRSFVQSAEFKSFSPRATLRWRPSPDLTVYGTVAKGNKPGDFNAGLQAANIPDAERTRLADILTVKEEKAWNYEVGAKAALMDRRLNVEAAAFYIDWTNQQLTRTERVTNVAGVGQNVAVIVNAGQTEVKGVELQGSFRVNPVLTLSASYGLSDAKFVRYEDSRQLTLTGNASVKGNRTPRAPQHTASFTADAAFPVRDGFDFVVRGDAFYQSTRFAQAENQTETGASTKVNLRVGVRAPEWSIIAFVNTVTDDRTALDITRLTDPQNFRPAFSVALPRGRQGGVTLTREF